MMEPLVDKMEYICLQGLKYGKAGFMDCCFDAYRIASQRLLIGFSRQKRRSAAPVEKQVTSTDQSSNKTDGGAAKAESETADKSKNSAEEPASADAELPNMPSPAQTSGAGFNPQDLSSGLNQKLMYKANIVMEIQDYGKAQSKSEHSDAFRRLYC